MWTFSIIVLAIGVVWIAVSNKEAVRKQELAKEEREAKDAEEAAEKKRLDEFLDKQAKGWLFQDAASIDGRPGLISLNETGSVFRLATYERESEGYRVLTDATIAIGKLRSIQVDQPQKETTRTHVDRVPVAIQTQKKSTIGRALVGGVVAGPVGAVVGGLSGVGADTEIQHHETRRTQTVMVKGEATLVISTGDFRQPIVKLMFRDNHILNEWSRRLWAARGW